MKFIFKVEEVPRILNTRHKLYVGNVHYGEDSPKKGIVNLTFGMGSKIRFMFFQLGLITHMDQPSNSIRFTLSKDKPGDELGSIKSEFIKDHLGIPLYTHPTDSDDVLEFCREGLIEVFGEIPRVIYMTIDKIDKK